MDPSSEQVGMVLGTEDATPLTFWVGVAPDAYLQLDDAVIVDTHVPGRGDVRIAGIVQDVRARHEGAQFDTDVFLIDRGVLPADTAVAAQLLSRFPVQDLNVEEAPVEDVIRQLFSDAGNGEVPA